MSDSEEEFASAGEEVTDEEVESADGGSKSEKSDAKAAKESEEAAKRKLESAQDEKPEKSNSNSGGDPGEREAKEDDPRNDAEVIQRQPPTGYAHPEEAKDPRSALENLAAKEVESRCLPKG